MKRYIILILSILSFVAQAQTLVPSFACGWEDNSITGSTQGHWGFVERVTPAGFTILNDGGAREGSYYARITVNSGDNPLAPASAGTERSEVYGPRGTDNTTLKENENSSIIQYAFSTKFDATWTSVSASHFMIFFQVKAPIEAHATNPVISFSATDSIRMKLLSGDMASAVRLTYSFTDGTLNIGNWIDWRITVNFKKDPTGFIRVERRNQGSSNFSTVLNAQNIRTLAYNSTVNNGAVGDHYIKLGLYRDAEPFTSILYNDGFSRSIYYPNPANNSSTGYNVTSNGKTVSYKGKTVKY